MKAIQLIFILFLAFSSKFMQAQSIYALADELIDNKNCVIGRIISTDETSFRFKIDNIIVSEQVVDTITFIKGYNYFQDSLHTPIKDTILIFLNRITGVDSIWTTSSIYFRVKNNAIQLDDCTVCTSCLRQAIVDYNHDKKNIIFNLQIGKKNSSVCKRFRKKSAVHQAIFDHLCELHYRQRIKQKQAVVIAPLKMNTLYMGVDNPLDISIPKHLLKRFYLTTNNGRIISNEYGYTIRVNKDTITNICVFDSDDTSKAVFCQQFRVKPFPNAVARFVGMKGGTVSKSLVLAAKRIDVQLENYDIDVSFTVVSYIIIIKDGNNKIVIKNKGSRVSAEFKDTIQKSDSITSIQICNILYQALDGVIREASPLYFKLKQ